MKNVAFWDVGPCRSCVKRRSAETSVHTRSTRRQIPENDILQNILNIKLLHIFREEEALVTELRQNNETIIVARGQLVQYDASSYLNFQPISRKHCYVQY
jgi:hypothetical protein